MIPKSDNFEKKSLQDKNVSLFLVICLPVSWTLMLISAGLTDTGKCSGLAGFLLTFSMLMPSIAGVICVLKNKEGIGTLMLLPKLRENGKLYLITIFGGALFAIMADVTVMILFPDIESLAEGAMPEVFFMMLLCTMTGVLGAVGILGEEIGWMGYLYPRLEKLWGIPAALFATGVIRALWHVVIYMQMNLKEGVTGFAVLCLSNIFLGSLLVLLTKRSGSIIPATIFHGITNGVSKAFAAYVITDAALYERHYVAVQFISLVPGIIVGVICAVILIKRSKKTSAGSESLPTGIR